MKPLVVDIWTVKLGVDIWTVNLGVDMSTVKLGFLLSLVLYLVSCSQVIKPTCIHWSVCLSICQLC